MTVERTCIGCRAQDERSRLLRLVVDTSTTPSRVVPDPQARLEGRGAWIHPVPQCVERAERRNAFPRALRVLGPVMITDVAAAVGAVTTEPTVQHGSRND